MRIQFTEDRLAKLPPAERLVTYWDILMSGFAMRHSPAGSKTFYSVGRPPGQEKNKQYTCITLGANRNKRALTITGGRVQPMIDRIAILRPHR